MTLFLPINRIQDELKKVEQFRKKQPSTAIFVKSEVDYFEKEEKNFSLSLILSKARKNKIIQTDLGFNTVEIDPKGIKTKKLKDLGYSLNIISLTTSNRKLLLIKE